MQWFKRAFEILEKTNLFGKGKIGLSPSEEKSSEKVSEDNKVRTAYALASFLAYVARADDHFDQTEEKRIHDICFPFYPRSSEVADRPPAEEWSSRLYEAMNDNTLADAVIDAACKDKEARDALLVFAWQIAASDGKVTDDEIEWISKVAVDLDANLIELEWSARPYYRTFKPTEDRFRAAEELGVSVTDLPDEVEKAYRKACDENYKHRPGSYDFEERDHQAKRYSEIYAAYKILSENPNNPKLFGLAPQATEPRKSESLEQAQCFICGNINALPETTVHLEARCSDCQALLFYIKDNADSLLQYNSPTFESMPIIE
ncbi:MAG: hypothetical protein P9L92_17005 [Candidatus Electryonea clarkiae]|nr:hypothetical protein [Candidatus Electryonea clarkiae]MDP8288213.1 hypothetical protein [Candidatus Electryonea clarkiae]